MAKYDAKCAKCEEVFEYEAPMCESGNQPPPCPKCGDKETVTLFGLNIGGFILIGGGGCKKGGY